MAEVDSMHIAAGVATSDAGMAVIHERMFASRPRIQADFSGNAKAVRERPDRVADR
jgi:hypothetical protein